MNVLFLTNEYNLLNIEQRLIQKLEYFNTLNYIKELSYLGFEYSFLYPLVLSIKSTKNHFYTLPLLRVNEQTKYLFNLRECSSICTVAKSRPTTTTNYHSYTLLSKSYNTLNPLATALHVLHHTGAKANWTQIYQLIGIRGYLSGVGNSGFKLPILNNFSKGLNIFEYFVSCLGARKGVVDTAIKTADSGYLTQRLVDLTQEVVVKENYCGTKHSCLLTHYVNFKGDFLTPHYLFMYGKIIKSNIFDLSTAEIITNKNRYICPSMYDTINTYKYNISELKLNSIKLCSLGRTICSDCLGIHSSATNFISTNIGMLVGQTVGEPSTQMTLRTFHTGGVYTISSQERPQNRDYSYSLSAEKKYKVCSIKKVSNISNMYNAQPLIYKINKPYLSLLSFRGKQYLKPKDFRWIFVLNNISLHAMCNNKILKLSHRNTIVHTSRVHSYFFSSFFNSLTLLVKSSFNKWIYINTNKSLIFNSYFLRKVAIHKQFILKATSINSISVFFKIVDFKRILYSNKRLADSFFSTAKVRIIKERSQTQKLKISTLVVSPLKYKKHIC